MELSFRDADAREERVTRTQLIPASGAPPESVGTPVSRVAALLRSDDSRWNVTGKNVAEYLHLTHLHTQAASLRLVTFNAKERWGRVSPLAGADRFERVKTNLINTKAALTKLKERRAQDLEDAIRQRRRWTDLLDRLAQTQKLAGAIHDVLTPRDVVQTIGDLQSRLALAAAAPSLSDDNDVGGASEAIRTLRLAIERTRTNDDRQLELLGRLRALPQQLADARSQHSAVLKRCSSLETEAAELKARVETLAPHTLHLQRLHEEAQRHRERRTEHHELITRTLRDREDFVRLKQDLTEAEEQLQEADRRLEAAEVELRRRREELAAHEQLLHARDRVRKQIDEIERATKALVDIDALQKRVVTEEARRSSLTERIRATDSAAAILKSEVDEREEALVVATRALEELQRMSAAIEKALLSIAEHVRHEDTACPVCRTKFDPGQLAVLVRGSIGILDPRLAEAESRVTAIRAGREELRRRETQLAQERRKLKADVRAVDENLSQLRSMIDELNKSPLLAGRRLEDAREQIARERDEQRTNLQRVERELAAARSAEELRQGVVDGATAADAQKRARALAHERRNTRQARAEEVRARIAQLQAEHPELAGSGQSLGLLIQGAALDASSAKDAADAAAMRFAEAQATEAATRQTLISLDDDVAKTKAQIGAIVDVIEGLQKRWRKAGLPEPVSEGTLDSEIEKLGQRRRDLDSALAEAAKISVSLERWQQATDLQALEQEIRSESGSLERDAYARELDAAVERARTASAVAEHARDAADELSNTLGVVTADFGDRALKPFDELFRRYLRALIHDERFHNIEATYEPAARTAGLRFKVDLGGSDTEAEYILSEGQLGEVSLAAMLAANSAFPWSRWQALLLDDPTQYNDLIHATALFDVLRNLVLFAQYQILVSTHDNEQAGFLRRKLDGVGIPWIDCRYIAHSPDGIVADIRTSSEIDGLAKASAS